MKAEKDELFEKFLAEANPSSHYVIRLARASYYTMGLFELLYPQDAHAPPAIINQGPTGPTGPTPMRLRYPIAMIQEAEQIVCEFSRANPDRRREMLHQAHHEFFLSKVRH